WKWLAPASLAVITTPFLANSWGWIFTEMGRQPWVVAPNPDGIPEVRLLTAEAASRVSAGTVLTSLIGFTLIYLLLLIVEVGLLPRFVKAGLAGAAPPPRTPEEPESSGTGDGGEPVRVG